MITVNGTEIKPTMFPDNTSQIWRVKPFEIEDTNYVHIKWDFEHEGEFMHLAQLKMLSDELGFQADLRLPYLPYGRQDKFINNTETFALHTFAELINSLEFNEVIINDPHSGIALDLIARSRATYPIKEASKVIYLTKSDLLCYPDNGAMNKYTPMFDMPSIWGNKVRDAETGNILSYYLTGNCKNKTVLIVDDLVDGGATFVLLAAQVLASGAKEINLFVTHGIFSKGLSPLYKAGIKRIFTHKGEVSEAFGNICYTSYEKLNEK